MDTAKDIVSELKMIGYSDSAIAAKTGSSQPTIWRIRKGTTSSCSSELYVALYALLDKARQQSTESVESAETAKTEAPKEAA